MIFLSLLYVLSALCLCACTGSLSDRKKLNNHISIDGVDVSEKTVEEARALLSDAAKTRIADLSLTLLLPEKSVSIPAGRLGITLDTEAALKEAAALGRKGGNRLIESPYAVNRATLREAVDSFAASYSTAAVDARVSIDRALAVPVSYQEEHAGVKIDADALYQSLLDAAQNGSFSPLNVPYASETPGVTLDALKQARQLVAQFSTSFERAPYSDENRVFNIKKAADLINGTVLQPDEEFDCNAVLGDRTGENGWRLAPAIRSGHYEDEYGGGVCQVSSTLFNAVMMADLTITEREPHSWPMGYVEIGRDATISTGGKNFRFVNSSDAPVYIFMYIDESAMSLTVSIYGAPLADGQYIVVTSEKTGTLESAGEEILLDESLPYNTRVILREARDGKTAVTYKEYYSRTGELLERVVAYRDTYRAIDGLVYVSTDLYYSG